MYKSQIKKYYSQQKCFQVQGSHVNGDQYQQIKFSILGMVNAVSTEWFQELPIIIDTIFAIVIIIYNLLYVWFRLSL